MGVSSTTGSGRLVTAAGELQDERKSAIAKASALFETLAISVICITFFHTTCAVAFSLPKIVLIGENNAVKRSFSVIHSVRIPLAPNLLTIIQFWQVCFCRACKFCRNRKQNRRKGFQAP